jgi:hypothetical protein
VEKSILVRDVQTHETRSGNTRFVLVDENGSEYTTFRPQIGKRALEFLGRPARIEYHEEQRENFRNVYLDAIEPATEAETEKPAGLPDEQADEVAWKTAVEAAPWLLGSAPSESEVPADELFQKLKPFKDLVEEDIEDGAEASRRREHQ